MPRIHWVAGLFLQTNNVTLRELPAEEYSRLYQVHEGFMPDPRNSVAIVAEDGPYITGRIFLLSPAHIEGPWVREDLRGSTACARLMKQAEESAKIRGIKTLFAYAVNDEIEGYLKRLGYVKAPMTVWQKDL